MKNQPELQHLAIIMDGNGRWAQARGHSRIWGHARGTQVAKRIIEKCVEKNIEILTLFAFSTENWGRPTHEVGFLMSLLERYLKREVVNLQKHQIRFRYIGDLSRIPESARRVVRETVQVTEANTGMQLVFALNYGGRQDIVQAAQQLARSAVQGKIRPEDIDTDLFNSALSTYDLPDPDCIIRTSGENRLSNFLLWQSAYSEFFFSPKYWPDFQVVDLEEVFAQFKLRERRFGKLTEQEPSSDGAQDREIAIF